jgi:hypothetical protein
VYAVAAETGQPVETVRLEQLRYRLGAMSCKEDGPPARDRCREWLYWQVWSARHQVGALPTTPPDDRLYDPRFHLTPTASAEAPDLLLDDDPLVQGLAAR